MIAALFGVEAAALLALCWWPGGSSTPLPALALWTAAFVAYALAAARGERVSLRTIWIGGAALRLGLVPAVPMLSEDVYRYMWDGWVQRNGINPYAFAPHAIDLEALRTDWWALVNHPEVPTIYPPGAQLVFLVLAAIGPAWIVFKLAWIALDLGAAWLLVRLVRAPERRAPVLLLYLWSPLLVVEVAWSAHLEPLGLVAMLAAILFAERGRGAAAGAALGLGAAVKLAPLAAVPAAWRRHGWLAAGLAVALPALLYLPYASAGPRLFEGLRTYADIWEFNPGLYAVLERLPGPAELPRRLGAVAVIAVAGWAAVRSWPVGRALYWTIGTALLVSPTIHPWYVLWVLPLACLHGGRGWILLTGTVFLAYAGRDAYLATGSWPEPAWLSLLIHAPPLALLAWDGVRGRDPERFERGGEIGDREQGGERGGAGDPA